MAEFRKYMHVERFGNDEVQGIELGDCYVFPKLDGTNASVWWNDQLCGGSRNRELSLDEDNAGFLAHALNDDRLAQLLNDHNHVTLYGEWLVPHSLKTYREDAWRKFYVFDVFHHTQEMYLPYIEYQTVLDDYSVDYVAPLCVLRNATYDNLLVELENNKFLIEDGKGSGEGIVLKNYTYQNRFGRVTWAKMVTNSFKEKHVKEMGHSIKNLSRMVEQEICDKYVGKHLIDKVYSKIVNEMEGWNSRYIPRLLQTVFYDLINEEIWNIVKEMKNPTINFKTLHSLTILKIKELKSELF